MKQVLSVFLDPNLDIEDFRGNIQDLSACKKWQIRMWGNASKRQGFQKELLTWGMKIDLQCNAKTP